MGENIAAVMELYPVGERFFPSSRSHAPACAAERGKKRIRALCRWHFQPGGGPGYCGACKEEELACAQGGPGADGRLCPYREHALISRQEHEAWNVLLACQGQLRLAPSGQVIGIDMHAALRLAAARGYASSCSRSCCRLERRAWSRRCAPPRVRLIEV